MLIKKVEFTDTAVHVGVTRSVHGNLPHILDRIKAHKKAMGATLSCGLRENIEETMNWINSISRIRPQFLHQTQRI